MSIERFYNTTFTVERMEWSGDSSGLVDQGTFDGHIQQADAQKAEFAGLRWTETFAVWCAVDTDVKEGDRLTADGKNYSVKAIQENSVGNNQHLELIVEKHE